LGARPQRERRHRRGENFKGLFVGIFKPEKFKVEYDRMNRDMAAEIARRYPAPVWWELT
jgi:hypothetical protein